MFNFWGPLLLTNVSNKDDVAKEEIPDTLEPRNNPSQAPTVAQVGTNEQDHEYVL